MPTRARPSATRRGPLREEVRRHVMVSLDRRWHRLWGSFGVAVILLSFAAGLWWHQGLSAGVRALSLTLAGVIVSLLHLREVRHWRQQLGNRNDWLRWPDQLAVAGGLSTSALMPAEDMAWALPLLAACAWGLWRLQQEARRHWAHWYFVAARRHLRHSHAKNPGQASGARQGSEFTGKV